MVLLVDYNYHGEETHSWLVRYPWSQEKSGGSSSDTSVPTLTVENITVLGDTERPSYLDVNFVRKHKVSQNSEDPNTPSPDVTVVHYQCEQKQKEAEEMIADGCAVLGNL